MDVTIITYDKNFDQVEMALHHQKDKIHQTLGLEIHDTYLDEWKMYEPEYLSLPPRSIVLVHGNMNSHYENIVQVCELQPQHPEVRFIISIDSSYNLFLNKKYVPKIQECLERGIHPKYPLSVIRHILPSFVDGKEYGRPLEHTLETYLRDWKELQK